MWIELAVTANMDNERKIRHLIKILQSSCIKRSAVAKFFFHTVERTLDATHVICGDSRRNWSVIRTFPFPIRSAGRNFLLSIDEFLTE